MRYLTTIGLEVHVQLKTRSKMFCGCAVEFGAGSNVHTCPTCLGLPGALPVMNQHALELTTLTGLMLNCEIAPYCKFDRKNYFYPDMPKNYQISQYDLPICLGGKVPLHDLAYPKDAQKTIATPDKEVGLVRIHLEEDVAKSFHYDTSTGIDFNRAGTPLMEIVTHPEIDSPEEAFAFLTSLRQILLKGGVSDADMEKGQLRCDCNVSVRPEGQQEFGAKIEIKNMNSVSGVRKALAYEIVRQTAELEAGRTLQQETRRWDDPSGQTFLMRTKENAHDYRYFPDPDLMPVRTETLVTVAQSIMPELPAAQRERFVREYELSPYDAAVLVDNDDFLSYFEATRATGLAKPKSIVNWLINDLAGWARRDDTALMDCPVKPAQFAEMIGYLDRGEISSKQSREQVFPDMWSHGKSAAAVIKEKGLEQLSDVAALEALCDEAVAANPKPVAAYKAGNVAALNAIKGAVMKLSKGRAHPAKVDEILQRKLAA